MSGIIIQRGAGGDISAGLSNIGNTSGNTGTVASQFILAGGNNITLSGSTNGQSMTITVSGPNIPAQSVESQTAGISNLGNTAGTSGVISGGQIRLLFAGGNNVTLSQSTNGASATITVSAFNQSVQPIGTNTLGISNLGNTAGTSGTINGTGIQLLLAGGNNVTLSQSINGSSATITVSGANIPAQTVESNTAGISNLGNTAGTSGVISGGQIRLLFAGGNNITLSQSTNGASATITVSGPTIPTQTVESQTAGISNLGNTAGTSGVISGGQIRLLFAGGNNITLSQSINGSSATVTISAPNLGAGAFSGGASNLGNTAGATGITGTQLVFVGGNNITLSQTTGAAGGTLSIIGPNAGGFSAGVSNLSNESGDTGVTGTRLVFAGGNNITLSQGTDANGATITISGAGQSNRSILELVPGERLTTVIAYTSSQFSNRMILQPFHMQGDGLTPKTIRYLCSDVASSNTASFVATWGVGFYSLANSTQLSLATSISNGFSYSTSSQWSGIRVWDVTGLSDYTLTEGRWFLAFFLSASATAHQNLRFYGADNMPAFIGYQSAQSVTAGTNNTLHFFPFWGVYSATSGAFPNTVGATQVNGGRSADLAELYIILKEI